MPQIQKLAIEQAFSNFLHTYQNIGYQLEHEYETLVTKNKIKSSNMKNFELISELV